jgi:hypothetical protein
MVMRSYRDRQTNHIAVLNEARNDLPDIVWVTQERRRSKRAGKVRQKALCQVNVQHVSFHRPPSSSALTGFHKYISNGAGIGILTALCLVLMSPDMATLHILLWAAIFSVLGLIAGALIYVLASIVITLLKIGLLLIAAVVVSGFLMRGCTQTPGQVGTEKTSAMQIGLKPQIDHGNHRIRLR